MSLNARVDLSYGTQLNGTIVAPHGSQFDDYNSKVIAAKIAKVAKCNYVINQGFIKSAILDSANEQADCNKLSHITSDPLVKAEFFDPLYGFSSYDTSLSHYIMLIHGCGNYVSKKIGKNVDVIIGAGDKQNRSCSLWIRDYIASELSKKYDVFIAGKNSIFAGKGHNNLNQLKNNMITGMYGGHYTGNCQCIQLEIVYKWRANKIVSRQIGQD